MQERRNFTPELKRQVVEELLSEDSFLGNRQNDSICHQHANMQ